MNAAPGVVSPDNAAVGSLDEADSGLEITAVSGTTAETFLTENCQDISLKRYDTCADAKNALKNGAGAARADDNAMVVAFAAENPGCTVGIPNIGEAGIIAPAVAKGNSSLLEWLNREIETLREENFFHAVYEAAITDTYGEDYAAGPVIDTPAADDGDTGPLADEEA